MYAIDAATIKGVEVLRHRRGVVTVAASRRRILARLGVAARARGPGANISRRLGVDGIWDTTTRGEGEATTKKTTKSLIYDEAGVQRWMTTTMKSSSTATRISAFFALTLR